MKIATTLVLSAGLMFSVPLAQAATHQPKTDILVQPISTELVQHGSEDILLHFDGAGTPYLYVEQQHGARLVVLNVNDLAHVKVVASVATGVARPYDFVEAIGDTLEQIRFRDGSGSAQLNMRAAKAPQIVNVEQTVAEPVKLLGNSSYLAVMTNATQPPKSAAGRDYRVIEFGSSSQPVVTIAGVTRIVERSETGTLFLLGSDGLTVIRSLSAEQENAAHEATLRGN